MIFISAFDAYQWAQGILVSFRSGRAFDPNPELFRGGTGGIGLKTLIAIDIGHLSEKACNGGLPCPYKHGDCLLDWYIPEPTTIYPQRTSHHIRHIEECLSQFEAYLKARGYLE
jgi:hypothetical protein